MVSAVLRVLPVPRITRGNGSNYEYAEIRSPRYTNSRPSVYLLRTMTYLKSSATTRRGWDTRRTTLAINNSTDDGQEPSLGFHCIIVPRAGEEPTNFVIGISIDSRTNRSIPDTCVISPESPPTLEQKK